MPIALTACRRRDHRVPSSSSLLDVIACSVCPNVHVGTLARDVSVNTATTSTTSFFQSPTAANMDAYIRSDVRQYADLDTSPRSCESGASLHCFNTHSPPILNLSPNLSPMHEGPAFDAREMQAGLGWAKKSKINIKNFYLNPPISNQNNRVWSSGKKADIRPDRLIIEREKFAQHFMVSAGVCFGGKGQLHFIDDKAKVNAEYYVGCLLRELIADCKHLLLAGFIFQQDGAPAHAAFLAQDWLNLNCPGFIEKDQWPPNSPDFNPLDYHVLGAMLEKYHNLRPKPKMIKELKLALEQIWEDLPQCCVGNDDHR